MIIYNKQKTTAVETVKVFTNLGRNGNRLGVVTDARGIDAEMMQKIAKTLGFSETSYVFPPDGQGEDYLVRFFTPKKEIPFAGHPSVGTLFVLLEKGLLQKKSNYVQKITGRNIALKVTRDGRIFMGQGKPLFGGKVRRETLVELLSLDKRDVPGEGRVVSTGLPHILVQLSSKGALRRAAISPPVYEKVRRRFKADCVMPFFVQGGYVFCRNFVPALGVAEDPATGSGGGALACYVVKKGKISAKRGGVVEMELFQGVGKVSQLFARVSVNDKGISGVEVGGFCTMGKKRFVSV
ncbi:MAG: PhzF family phenazine biosynthesis protein [Nitrospinae bacterium]|nr:PhzF family phenazine biosynthesis protein [Nitrospinota bacterium]